jgi:hypothetical protein
MYADLNDTLGALKSRAVFCKRDFSQAPMAQFLEGVSKSSVKGQANIEEAAIAFYLSNHGFHLLESRYEASQEMLAPDAKLAKAHVALASSMGLRMFHYLLTISAEEAQFGTARNDRFHDFVESATSPAAAKWLKGIMDRGGGRGSLGSAKSVGDATMGQCVKALELCFRFAGWSGGFGGLPWAQIAETAGEVIRGTNSLELMVDKAFTLCHNNGAIFNKGHQFTTYRQDFYDILDIQASGQMPSAIHAGSSVTGMRSDSVKALHAGFAASFPEEFNAKFDPSKVKSMGEVRRKKMEAASKKANAFLASGGGFSAAAANSPPKRACDDLFTLDDLAAVSGSALPSQGFGL